MIVPEQHLELARQLIQFLRNQRPHALYALRQQHRNDGTGHCTVCSAGAQTGRLMWPCLTYTAAHAALEAAQRRPEASPPPRKPGCRAP